MQFSEKQEFFGSLPLNRSQLAGKIHGPHEGTASSVADWLLWNRNKKYAVFVANKLYATVGDPGH